MDRANVLYKTHPLQRCILRKLTTPLLLFFLFVLPEFPSEAQSTQPGTDQSTAQSSPENLKARKEFQDAKFGMFIHWGIYSLLGNGEWIFH